MTGDEMVQRLMGYYKASYSPERIDQLKRFCSKINQAGMEDVFNRIIEERQKDGAISVADIKEAAIAAGVSFSITRFVEVIQWTCDCCGHQFKYAIVPTDDDKIDRDIFDFCPICGFQVNWTIARNKSIENGGNCPLWYTNYIDEYREGGKIHKKNDASNPAYNRIKDYRARAEENRRLNDLKVAAMETINKTASARIYESTRGNE
jgi:hypothetical protein